MHLRWQVVHEETSRQLAEDYEFTVTDGGVYGVVAFEDSADDALHQPVLQPLPDGS